MTNMPFYLGNLSNSDLSMRKAIHPKYSEAEIQCACGNVVKTRSTVPVMKIEVCSACHPFYTGKKKIVDATGRVDRFKKRFEKSQALKEKATVRKQKTPKSTKPSTPKKA